MHLNVLLPFLLLTENFAWISGPLPCCMLHLGSDCSSPGPHLQIIGNCWSIEWAVNEDLHLFAQSHPHHQGSDQSCYYSRWSSDLSLYDRLAAQNQNARVRQQILLWPFMDQMVWNSNGPIPTATFMSFLQVIRLHENFLLPWEGLRVNSPQPIHPVGEEPKSRTVEPNLS